MASARVKKVIIPKGSLPAVGPNNDYLVRYRIVSEDKNRSSHWSHLWRLPAQPVDEGSGGVEVRESMITITWQDNPSSSDKKTYDILISVDGSDFEYIGSTQEHTYTFIKPVIESEITMAVQVESYLKIYSTDLVVFDQTVVV
jgi:hypothetical protein